jgi:hypothetical protein
MANRSLKRRLVRLDAPSLSSLTPQAPQTVAAPISPPAAGPDTPDPAVAPRRLWGQLILKIARQRAQEVHT